ncbi:hypothetical protein [Shewanella sp. UCD-KL21]|uniref:hypothetical protein n=1 Tax=Shewanella sp. UCD-KL21 TaxID=1917164 RepID=UPI00097069C1|nr:hypothetical protein [Shewanella sp. UCD-KL21]
MKGLITAALLSFASSDCVVAPQDSLALAPAQRQQLKHIVVNNAFVSGCVTEQLTDITEKMCPKDDAYCCDSEIDSEIAIKSHESIELTYQQWVNIYLHCMVK